MNWRNIRTQPTPPPPKKNNEPSESQNPGLMGNLGSSVVSGFGMGSGIEVVKGVGNMIFGDKNSEDKKDSDYLIKGNTYCIDLYKIIEQCNNENTNIECEKLKNIFKKTCVSEEEATLF
jgi:hypothetical protein